MKLGVLARSVVRGRIPWYGIPWECWGLGVGVPGVESHGILFLYYHGSVGVWEWVSQFPCDLIRVLVQLKSM